MSILVSTSTKHPTMSQVKLFSVNRDLEMKAAYEHVYWHSEHSVGTLYCCPL